MKQTKKNIYRLSLMVLLIFSWQYSIAAEDASSTNNSSASESNDQISFSQTCSPLPECARENDYYQPDELSNWVVKMMEVLQENEEESEHNNS